MSDHRFSDAIQHIIRTLEGSLADISDQDIECSVKKMIDAEKIFVYGSGRSGLAGRTFAMRLMQIGCRAFFIGETITPAVTDKDCVFFVSKTGETDTAIQAAKIVKNKVEAKSILLTATPDSTLATYCDEIIYLDIPESEKDKELAPLGTIFESTAMIFLDGMIAELMERLDVTEKSMRMRHPILV